MAQKMTWVKLHTGIFDNDKIVYIEGLEHGAEVVLIWIKLLVFCGRTNNGGFLRISDRIPHNAATLAHALRVDKALMAEALDIFEQLAMVETIEGVIVVSGWREYQSVDKYEALKEKDRQRKQEERAKKKAELLASTDASMDISMDNPGTLQGQSEECPAADTDTDSDTDTNTEYPTDTTTTTAASERIDYQAIISLYNQFCQNLPRCVKLTDGRRKAIKARINGGYTVEDFNALFQAAGQSSFLQGKNKNNWTADIDWLLKDNNMAKVLEGKYADRNGGGGAPSGPRYDYSDTEGSF